jgi:phosphohistidine phosphatase
MPSGTEETIPPVPLVLDLLRHGEAASAAGGPDQERRLTPGGEAAIRRLAERLAPEPERPARVFSSPARRALDTAAILLRGLGLEIPIEELEELTPEHAPAALLDELARRGATGGHLLLVGHQPQMGLMIEHLTGATRGVKPGELVRIECPGGAGRRRGTIARGMRPE